MMRAWALQVHYTVHTLTLASSFDEFLAMFRLFLVIRILKVLVEIVIIIVEDSLLEMTALEKQNFLPNR